MLLSKLPPIPYVTKPLECFEHAAFNTNLNVRRYGAGDPARFRASTKLYIQE
jgi:hypothetical protein